ncbi:hypothetical protein T01_9367 [Trichinella spiralis]|uniref:Uncharacterized protein n=1 Tax=Trichinella spiralis TaxID=6334 RepID=A0A0V1AQ92_TRISP|nr:hypothetical protein T01_9367 [Trichinella spiralis]
MFKQLCRLFRIRNNALQTAGKRSEIHKKFHQHRSFTAPSSAERMSLNWSPECKSAFTTQKEKLTTSPVLGFLNLDTSFILDVEQRCSSWRCTEKNLWRTRPYSYLRQ